MDIVLGAGIVGVSTALHLQARGRDVVLLDRRGAGEETSHGNAGLIERTDLLPRAFPRALKDIMHYAMNRDPRVRYDLASLAFVAPWLARYWWHSDKKSVEQIARFNAPLFEHSLREYEALLPQAGASDLLRPNGWLHLSRNPTALQTAMIGVEYSRRANLDVEVLDSAQIAKQEPALREKFAWGIHLKGSASISNPGKMVKCLADLFVSRGGRMTTGDAKTLTATNSGWTVQADTGNITAKNAVVALGPWSDTVFKPLGYKIPFAVKRGYHMNYQYAEKGRLNIPVIDADNGFVLSPMQSGTRLTTGIEFALRDDAPSPKQFAQVEPVARNMLPMGDRQLDQPWMGSRPCTADMRPVIGPAHRHKGLWFAFGHAHHGLTLGPVTGRLIAEMMTKEKPIANPTPFSVARFD